MVMSASRGSDTAPQPLTVRSIPDRLIRLDRLIRFRPPLTASKRYAQTLAEVCVLSNGLAETAQVRLRDRARLGVVAASPHLRGQVRIVPEPRIRRQHQPSQQEERVDLVLVLGGQGLHLAVAVGPQRD